MPTGVDASLILSLTCFDYHLPGETPEVFALQHGIVIFTEVTTPRQVERTLDGQFQREQAVEGDILIVPAFVGHRAH